MKKKKLLLINPWQSYRKDLETEYQSYIPYGLVCIAAIGRSVGFETQIIDCLEDETKQEDEYFIRFGKTRSEVETRIKEFGPDIVGISSIFTMFESDAIEIAELVKRIDQKIIVILGGATATIREVYERLLVNMDVFDIMCRGEGEETFQDILNNYNSVERKIYNLKEIAGIAFKENGKVIITKDRPFNTNLDALPFPALDLLDLDKIFRNKYFSRWRNKPLGKKALPIFTSRGCPYNCCFCSVHSQVGYKYRAYSNEYIINLMKYCIENYGVEHFHIEDDNLTFNVERIKDLLKQMISLHITWDTPNGVRADKIDEEMIHLMKKSGISSISIAAEAGSERVRNEIIHKNLRTESIIYVADLCNKYDIPCIVFFVLGFPGEKLDDIKKSIILAKYLAKAYNTINMIYIANPLPGTELNKIANQKGYIKRKMKSFDYFTAIRINQAPVIETEDFSKEKIYEIVKKNLCSQDFIVHNAALPMFWFNNQISCSRAKKTFPNMSNKEIVWEWKCE